MNALQCKYWILSLESAEYKGLLTAKFVEYMEN
jgi:hypothetical protein